MLGGVGDSETGTGREWADSQASQTLTGGGLQVQAIAMIYSVVTAVCILDVFSARREQRATFAFAYRQV